MTPEPDIEAVYRAAAVLCERFILPSGGGPGLAQPLEMPTRCLRGNGCECWHEKALPAALDALHAAFSPKQATPGTSAAPVQELSP